MDKIITALEGRIGYSFKDKTLPVMALTHSSYANERKINKSDDYERLEFLGDAVVELTVSEFLFGEYPDKREGEMTKIRASLVCEPTLAACARELGVPELLLLGKGERLSGGMERDSILCDVFEAIAGALYLDGGFGIAKKYIEAFVLKDWKNKIMFTDSKTILQEYVQKLGESATYRTVSEEGPANDRVYTEVLIIGDKEKTKGRGSSKKSAQQQAAYEYLLEIGYGSNKCI